MNASKIRQRWGRQAGFTLLEVLVAFAILAVSLGTLLQTFGQGLRNAALVEEYTQATLYAESVLALVGVEEPLAVGPLGGELDDKYAWRGEVIEYIEEDAETTSSLSGTDIAPFLVTVEVFWDSAGKPRSLTLATLRLSIPEDLRQ